MLLHGVLGYTVAETAAAMGVPLNTVRSRLITAKATLRQHWEDHPELVELVDLAKGAS
jgi:DNA-directed RNA polymerase specialized sigma24 family protein